MSNRSLNKVTLIGNLTRDPEMRYTPQGTAVTTFSIATNRSWKTDSGEVREEVEFHRIVSWNKLAELCSQLLTKGRKVYVEGRLQTRTFTGSDNAQHTITEIVIDDMMLLDSKRPDVPVSAGMPVVEPVVPVVAAVQEDTATPKKTAKKVKDEPVRNASQSDAGGEVKEEKKQEMNENVNVDDIPF